MGTPIDGGFEAQGEENAPGPNPAWNDVLSVIPEDLHSQVTPYFQQWDQSAQQRVEQANSKIKDFEAYSPFVEHGIAPDELERGLQLMYQINTNPQEVWQALGEAYNLTPKQAQQAVENGDIEIPGANATPDVDLSNHPAYQQLQQGLELVSQIVLNDQQAKQAAVEDAALEKEMVALKSKHGEFDEDYVLSQMDRGKTGDEAIAAYQALIGRVGGNPAPFAPNILGATGGAGSGYPSRAIDPTKLTPNATRDLVKQMLDASNREG